MTFFAKFMAVACAILAGAAAAPALAHDGGGWNGGGWQGGLGVSISPVLPYYAAPPGYYAPYPGDMQQPPAPPAPPAPGPLQNSGGTGQSCNAGPYICPMQVPVPAGEHCYCHGNNGEHVYGSAE